MITLDFFQGFMLGSLLAGCWAAWLVWKLSQRKVEVKHELNITPEVASQITRAMVEEWLEIRGLTWMPKGPEFNPKPKRRPT